MIRKLLPIALLAILFVNTCWSKEGLWVPILLKKYNIDEMQQMGFRLSAEDVYDVNNASLKDAVVLFGGGCTGELISGEGLLITNHHCGYRQIQMHSSVEHDYLTDGFWAMEKSGELPCPGLTVSFLERMEDVTDKVLEGTKTLANNDEKAKKINENSRKIETDARQKGKFSAQVKPFFYGNQYFLHVYKVFTDVRLVGAPPSSIGKFGGDTDNWVWPRHTGDFSLFRIYAGINNEPAPYAIDNQPFKPKKFFPVSLKGVQPGDFTMVFGYPGRTTQFLTSSAVELIMNQRNSDRVAIREQKLHILDSHMRNDPVVRIQYSAKHAGISNAWKKWQGETMGLKRLNAVEKKKDFEKTFISSAVQNSVNGFDYLDFFKESARLYNNNAALYRALDYYNEIVVNGIESFTLSGYLQQFIKQAETEGKITEDARNMLDRQMRTFYKDYNRKVDQQLFSELLPLLLSNVDPAYLPSDFQSIIRKYPGERLNHIIFSKSVLSDSAQLRKMASTDDLNKLKKLSNDPVIAIYLSLRNFFDTQINPKVQLIESEMDENMTHYLAGILKMKEGDALYPDANSTLRVSYGQVEGYDAKDGVRYLHATTLDGIIEKAGLPAEDYRIPEKLKTLHGDKDYGNYGENGVLPVCFVASNHTSGGNSGSPVINGNGELIGVNFDRCWEGTMSDIMFDPDRCRNISLDIRYALFVIDKFAGAGYLLNEMEIRK